MTIDHQHTLDVDIGNTRIKWRVGPQASVVLEGVCDHSSNLLEYFSDLLGEKRIERVRVASVVKGGALDSLRVACQKLWGVELELAKVQQEWAGVTQGYDDFTRLGVDRWLGVLAAYNKYNKACLVVSCGTAVTLDFVDVKGVHLGGYIVPGLNLMRRSLFGGTDAVKVESFDVGESLEPGRNTERAVSNGLLLMLTSTIKQSCDRWSSDKNIQVVVCGGDGELVGRHLSGGMGIQNICERTLVLDGLAFALP